MAWCALLAGVGFHGYAAQILWVAGNGDWNNPTNWVPAHVPGPNDDAVITNGETFAVTVTAPAAAANLFLGGATGNQTLTLRGAPLTLSGTASLTGGGVVEIAGGTLQGGTVASTNNPAVIVTTAPGTMDGVTLAAPLTVGARQSLSFVHGLILSNTLSISGTVYFTGEQTLGGQGEIVISAQANVYYGTLYANDGIVTIGSGILIHGAGGEISGQFINAGTIASDTPGSRINIESLIQNRGYLSATNGASLYISSGNSTWTNSGRLIAAGGALVLGGIFDSQSISSTNVLVTNGSVTLSGTIDNTGKTIDLNVLGPLNLSGGAIKGGTLTGTNDPAIYPTLYGSTLDGVTLNAPLTIESGNSLTLSDGLLLNSTMTIRGTLLINGNQTLGGNGNVFIMSQVNNYYGILNANYGTLTIGPGILVHGTGGEIFGQVINNGTIASDNPGSRIDIPNSIQNWGYLVATNGASLYVGSGNSTWTNSGQMIAAGGALFLGGNFDSRSISSTNVVVINGTVTLNGTVDNTDRTIDLNILGPLNLSGGTIIGGVLTGTNDPAIYTSQTGSALTDVTINTSLRVSQGSYLKILNHLALNGKITLFGTLQFSGDQALDGDGEIIMESQINIYFSFLNAIKGTLTIAPSLAIHGAGGFIQGNLINYGTITSDRLNGIINLRDGTLVNFGALIATNGATLNISSDSWTNSGTLIASGGTMLLGGSFGTGSVAAIQNVYRDGVIKVIGIWDNSGKTINLDMFGVLYLASGTIQGGTINGTNDPALYIIPNETQFSQGNSTLDGVTLNARAFVNSFSPLYIKNGLTLNRVITLSVANDGGYFGRLVFDGNQMLTGRGEIDLASASAAIYAGANSTLTIGPDMLLHGMGGTIGAGTSTIINTGTINSDFVNGKIRIAGNFINAGLVKVQFGTLEIYDYSAGSDGSARFLGQQGHLQIDDGTLNLIGETHSVSDLNLTRSNIFSGQINLFGSLDLAGSTLNTDLTGLWTLLGGTIRGGTISGTNALRIPANQQGILDGVTLSANAILENVASLIIKDGLTLNGELTVEAASVDFSGTQTISGIGSIRLDAPDQSFLFADFDSTVTIGPDILIHGTGGDIFSKGGSWINQGRIAADVPLAHIRLGGNITNSGTIAAEESGTEILGTTQSVLTSEGDLRLTAGSQLFLRSGGSLELADPAGLDLQPDGVIIVSGNLVGSTRNFRRFQPRGAIKLAGAFNGPRNVNDPQMFEAMSNDAGPNAIGLIDNFSYNLLEIDMDTYVRLVDLDRNSGRTNSEALYVNILTIASGATLDLNGLNVYARAIQIDASAKVVGGKISIINGGGPIDFGTPASGWVAPIGQSESWSFYGRTGEAVSAFVSLNGSLAYAQVELYDSQTNLFAAITNSAPNSPFGITNVSLPANGIYQLRISAPTSQLGAAGPYQLIVWDVTSQATPLPFGQSAMGHLKTPFSNDQWTFSATAGQQVQFSLLSSSAPGIAFDLIGPSGPIGFTNATASAGLIDLPQSGTYTVRAYSPQGQYGIDYAFKLNLTPQTGLAIGSNVADFFAGNGQAQLLAITNTINQPLRFTLTTAGTNNRTELYAGFGVPPTRGSFIQADAAGSAANREILVNNAYAGLWFVLVYGDNIATPGAYSLTADSGPLFITGVTPAHGGSGSSTTVEIQGAGFLSNAKVSLEGSGLSPIAATNLTWVSSAKLIADLDLSAVPTNTYQLTVLQGTNTATLRFPVIAAVGPKFQANLITPGGVGLNTVNTFYVEYSNTGDTPMPAPMLVVSANSSDGGWGVARFSLDPSQLSRDFYAASGPANASDKATFFASGKIPGVLLPGESGRVPVYFLGWALSTVQQFAGPPPGAHIIGWRLVSEPVGSSGSIAGTKGFTFQLSEFLPPSFAGTGNGQVQPDQPLSWQSLLTNVPPNIPKDAWSAIWINYTNDVGNTLYSYFGMLQREVSYLYRLGILGSGAGINSVNDLANFAILRADGLPLIRTLASATDAYAPTPSLRLSFERTFPNTISGRYRLGRLGRGWSDNWDYHLKQATNGDVTVSVPGGGVRTFKPDLRGGYTSDLGDYGQLVSQGSGSFVINEKGGLAYYFDSSGNLSSIQDPNGNNIACGYNGGLLTSLTHSAGQYLKIGYTEKGRIQTVSDPVGRTTTLSYDAVGEHLTNVMYFDNRNISYEYSSENGAASEHSLTAVQNPDQSHQFFSYDSRGRLRTTSRDEGAESITYNYDNVATVYSTDAFTNTSSFFSDNRGLLVRIQDPQSNVTQLSRDIMFNLTSVTDSAGKQYQYVYDNQGNVTGITDPLGNQTRLFYSGPFRRLSQLVDADTNTASYGYDSNGNLLNIRYADDSIESWSFKTCCEPATWTNRRSQGVRYEYNPTNGFLISKSYSDGTRAAYTYDLRGNLRTASNYTGVILMDYYPNNDRLRRITYPGGQWLEYVYDSAGRRQAMTDHLGYRLSYDYDDAGRLRSIINSENSQIVLYQYNQIGRMQRKTLANGAFTIYDYDPRGHLQTLTNALADGSVLSFFNYIYDERGRCRQVQTVFGIWAYDYDNLGQLTKAVLTSTDAGISNQSLTYVYDALGNRKMTIENGVTTLYSPNNRNQYVLIGTTNFTFDLDGNIFSEITSNTTNLFTFDIENHLTRVINSTNEIINQYDALGNQAVAIVNGIVKRLIIDPVGLGNIVAEYDDASSLSLRNDYGIGMISSSGEENSKLNYLFDALGNTQQIIDQMGQVVAVFVYNPFGVLLSPDNEKSSSSQFVGEAGGVRTAAGLHLMRQRYYCSALGRFISQDPLGIRTDQLNLYDYALNSPANLIDPNGMLPSKAWAETHPSAVVAGVVAGAVATPFVIAGATIGAISGLDAGTVLWLGGANTFYQYINLSIKVQPWVEPVVKSLVDLSATPLIKKTLEVYGGRIATYLAPVLESPAILAGISFGIGWQIGSTFRETFDTDKVIFEYLDDLVGGWSGILNYLNPQSSSARELVPIYAYDPNQKLILSGQGSQGFVRVGTLLPYRIDFQNATNATAPAQQVFITDQLTNMLDWSTIEITEIQFGDQLLTPPAGSQHFVTNLPVTLNGSSFNVEIEAGIRLPGGQFFATFRSVDPTTDLPPPATVGFLPPDDGFGRGQGHVSYLIRPKTGLPSGTEIRNVALVDFANGEVIATDQVAEHDPSQGVDPNKQALVTIDAAPPTSAITALPTNSTASFLVQWSGRDDAGGSGIATYDIYASTNGGPFGPWIVGTTNTSGTFAGTPGNAYAFYSVARDLAGNVESPPAASQAKTTVYALPQLVVSISVQRSPDGQPSQVTITFPTQLGFNYTVEFQDRLDVSAPWTTVAGAPHNSGVVVGSDLVAERFYRVRQTPKP